MTKVIETYKIKGKELIRLFDDLEEFERVVTPDELISLLNDKKCVVFEAERLTELVDVEDDWTVMK